MLARSSNFLLTYQATVGKQSATAFIEHLRARTQGRHPITLQLFEIGETAQQCEDQRLEGPGDFQTVAGRPIRVGGDGSNALEQLRAGKEAVGPEIPGHGDNSPLGNTALLP